MLDTLPKRLLSQNGFYALCSLGAKSLAILQLGILYKLFYALSVDDQESLFRGLSGPWLQALLPEHLELKKWVWPVTLGLVLILKLLESLIDLNIHRFQNTLTSAEKKELKFDSALLCFLGFLGVIGLIQLPLLGVALLSLALSRSLCVWALKNAVPPPTLNSIARTLTLVLVIGFFHGFDLDQPLNRTSFLFLCIMIIRQIDLALDSMLNSRLSTLQVKNRKP